MNKQWRALRLRLSQVLILGCVLVGLSHASADAANDRQLDAPPGKIVAQAGDAYIAYDAATRVWEIGNNSLRRRMAYRANAGYRLIRLTNKQTNREWLAPGSGNTSELRMQIGGEELAGSAQDFALADYQVEQHPDQSLELIVALTRREMRVRLHYLIFPNVSVLEQWGEIENIGKTPLGDLTLWESFSVALRPSPEPLTLYWVQGLGHSSSEKNPTEPVPTLRLRSARLDQGADQQIRSVGRSSEEAMGWFTLAAPNLREGVFGGIEWSGDWQLRASRDGDDTHLRAGLQGIRVPLPPGGKFESPRRFFGFYRGDLDDASNALHAFARAYLLRPRPADFPWTQYNTWFAYYTNIDEATLQREADMAAELGLEVFYVDAGWYEGSPPVADFSFGLGTWRENREKFPSGLGAFADYVHRKGMKFGLWVEPERVDVRYVGPGKDISPEWLADYDPNAELPEGAARTAQICFGNPQARAWAKTWLTRLIRDYQLDWLKWDDNGWATCNPPGQAGDGDLAHVRGLYEIFDYLRAEFPNLIIENCASGGHRMDYGLMRRTDIAWLSDETDPSYRVRYHVAGASYAFPPEYLNTWLVESYFENLEKLSSDAVAVRALLRSRMLGAFGISAPLQNWSADLRANVAAEIARYKTIRPIIATGKHYRLLPQNDLSQNLEPPTEPDAVEFFDPRTNTGAVFLFRGGVSWTDRRVVLKGLEPNSFYEVTSVDGAIHAWQTGRQLMTQSLRFPYTAERLSALLLIKPLGVSTPTR